MGAELRSLLYCRISPLIPRGTPSPCWGVNFNFCNKIAVIESDKFVQSLGL
jgi:hypothetical protein